MSGVVTVTNDEPAVAFPEASGLSSVPAYAIELWSSERCAWELRLTGRGLSNLGRKGPPSVRLGGRKWYRPEGVKRWLEQREK